MADTVFSNWLSALSQLQASVSKDLAEIRKQKAEIQQLKTDVFNRVAQGRYIRDDQRLVLSAPEIVIVKVVALRSVVSVSVLKAWVRMVLLIAVLL